MPTARVNNVRHRREWSTFQLLQAARLALLLLDVLLLMAAVSAIESHRAALQTIGKDAAPSIIAAQRIRTAVAGMDAQLAAQLISNNEDNTAAALARYNAERAEVAMSLLSAAENITYGDAERRPIRTLQNGLAQYEELAERSRDLHDLEHGGGATSSAAILNSYRQAARMTDQTLLPAAENLGLANSSVLESTYRHDRLRSGWARFLIVLSALACVALLLATQRMLSRRMHRTFNPALLVATLLVMVLPLHVLGALSASHRELTIATEDALHSVGALWHARAAAFVADREANRALLEIGGAAEHEQGFASHAQAVAELSTALTTDQLVAALREGRQVDGFSGYLADELRNTTFPGERESALESLAAWEAYVADQEQVRRLEDSGQHRRAVELATGAENTAPDLAFQRFDRAIGNTLGITQRAFNTAVENGFAALRGLEMEAVATAILVAVLLFAGFAPRLREYR